MKPITYLITIHKQIHGNVSACSTEDADLIREVTLPFFPVPGMNITIDDDFEFSTSDVYFDIRTGLFSVYIDSDETFYVTGNNPRYAKCQDDLYFKKYIDEEYIAKGWKIGGKGNRYRNAEKLLKGKKP